MSSPTAIPSPKKKKAVVVVKRRRPQPKAAVSNRGRSVGTGIPRFQSRNEASVAPHTTANVLSEATEEEEEFPADDASTDVAMDSLPCDTLLAIRSLIQGSQSLQVPLLQSGNACSCVLESQLYSTLVSHDDSDSVVTKELQHLLVSNQVRRLTDAGAGEGSKNTTTTTTIQAIMESKDYVRAVWDAHRAYKEKHDNESFLNDVTTCFVSNLKHWTKRTITHEQLQEAWKATKMTATSHTFDSVVDTLVHMQVVLPVSGPSSSAQQKFILWLPNWGLVLQQLWKAEKKVIQQIKRSMYKELLKSQLENQSYPGLSGSFVMQHLLAQGKIEIQERPAGAFVKIATAI